MEKICRLKANSKTSFLITIHCQENHTWQGVIQWLDKNVTQHFRSELELIKLMDEAVNQQSIIEVDSRTWSEDYKAVSS